MKRKDEGLKGSGLVGRAALLVLRKRRQVRLLAMWMGETRCICCFLSRKAREGERKKRGQCFGLGGKEREGGKGGDVFSEEKAKKGYGKRT